MGRVLSQNADLLAWDLGNWSSPIHDSLIVTSGIVRTVAESAYAHARVSPSLKRAVGAQYTSLGRSQASEPVRLA